MNPITITCDGEGIDFTAQIGPKGNVRIVGKIAVSPPVPTPIPVPVPTPTPSGLRVINAGPISWEGQTTTKYSGPFIRGEAYVYEMTTGDASSAICNVTVAEYAGAAPIRTISISETEMYFPLNPHDLLCSVGVQASVFFTVGESMQGVPTLKPNTKYFVNIKNCNQYQDPSGDTCLPGESCTFVLNLRH